VTTLFISDLHLDGARPDITSQFLDFLQREAAAVERLYILGDLFEAWIGDDDPDADKHRVRDALRVLTQRGTPCFLMHGNRDFLIGSQFAAATGVQLIDDGTVVDLYGRKVLLMHGDTLCTDDHAYKRLRRIVRNPVVQWLMRRLSLSQRLRLAAKMRASSKARIESVSRSTPDIMDVNNQAVVDTLRRYHVDCMIHGHTHRPAIHDVEVDGRHATRIVLGDWYEQGSVLRWREKGYELVSMVRGGRT
jgi:UDP-2,3-diacylglucosamine hydrolase